MAGYKAATPVTARGERTRAALIAAARRVFERDGFGDSRLTDITAEANCSTGSFYTYFDSKEEILEAVLSETLDDMMHPGMPRVDADIADDPETVLAAANRAYFEAYRRNARIMTVFDEAAGALPRFRDQRRMRGWEFAERNAKHIRALQEKGVADPDLDALQAARALSGMVSQMAFHTFGLGDEIDMDTLVFTATRLWVNAIGLRQGRANSARPLAAPPPSAD